MPMNVNIIIMTTSTAGIVPAMTVTTITMTMSTAKNVPAMSMSITTGMNTITTTITTITTIDIMVMKTERRAESG